MEIRELIQKAFRFYGRCGTFVQRRQDIYWLQH